MPSYLMEMLTVEWKLVVLDPCQQKQKMNKKKYAS